MEINIFETLKKAFENAFFITIGLIVFKVYVNLSEWQLDKKEVYVIDIESDRNC